MLSKRRDLLLAGDGAAARRVVEAGRRLRVDGEVEEKVDHLAVVQYAQLRCN